MFSLLRPTFGYLKLHVSGHGTYVPQCGFRGHQLGFLGAPASLLQVCAVIVLQERRHRIPPRSPYRVTEKSQRGQHSTEGGFGAEPCRSWGVPGLLEAGAYLEPLMMLI